ncbi:hypothetical protein Dimus_005371 [Dionaea muscipula]
MHIDACKEFYANLTLYHYKKKEVARSRVRGVEIEFDSMRLVSILGIPGNNGIYEYIKGVWEESKCTKPLEIIRKFSNDNMIMVARRVRSVEMKPFQRFVHFMVMKNVVPRGESGSDDQFYDAQVEFEEPVADAPAVPVFPASPGYSTNMQKEPATAGVDPSIPSSSILDSMVLKLQAELEQARARRLQADLEKAQPENV